MRVIIEGIARRIATEQPDPYDGIWLVLADAMDEYDEPRAARAIRAGWRLLWSVGMWWRYPADRGRIMTMRQTERIHRCRISERDQAGMTILGSLIGSQLVDPR